METTEADAEDEELQRRIKEKEEKLLRDLQNELNKPITGPIKESTVDYYNQNKDKVSSITFLTTKVELDHSVICWTFSVEKLICGELNCRLSCVMHILSVQHYQQKIEYTQFTVKSVIVVFTTHVPVFFWPRRHNF